MSTKWDVAHLLQGNSMTVRVSDLHPAEDILHAFRYAWQTPGCVLFFDIYRCKQPNMKELAELFANTGPGIND